MGAALSTGASDRRPRQPPPLSQIAGSGAICSAIVITLCAMVRTAPHDDHGGFRILVGSWTNGDSAGEAYVQAPDGTTCHVEWQTPGDLHFEDVPMKDDAQGSSPLGDAEEDHLRSIFPDLARSMEQSRANDAREHLEVMIPGLVRGWEAWRAAQ